MLAWGIRVRTLARYFRWRVGYLEEKILPKPVTTQQSLPSIHSLCWTWQITSDTAGVLCSQPQQVCNTAENDSAAVWFLPTEAMLWQIAREFPPSLCSTEVSSSCCCFLRTTRWCPELSAVSCAQRHRCMQCKINKWHKTNSKLSVHDFSPNRKI